MPIDHERVRQVLVRLSSAGDANGLIAQLGVYMTRVPAQFYTRLNYGFERAFGRKFQGESAKLLINCGHVCVYNMFQAISQSREWAALVKPMIETPADFVDAGLIVCSALGWADVTVENTNEDGALFMAHSGYEVDGYRQDYGVADHAICYKLTGLTAGLMDLAYGQPFPNGLHSFHSQEMRCRAMGHDCCEFVTGRVRPQGNGTTL